MTKTLHTPWIARPSGYLDGLWTVEDAQGGIVFFGMEKDVAHLFAAAPEMLAALKECLGLAKIAEALTGCRSDDDYVWGIRETLERVIPLAEGRASLPAT